MSVDKREKKLAKQREYNRKRRANETAKQRKARLAKQREYNRKRRANETAEQREARLIYHREYMREYTIKRIIRELNNEHK